MSLIPLSTYREYSPDEMKRRANEFLEEMSRRRSVRQFSNRPVSRDIIENCLRAAVTSPSGANMQPWSFVVVSDFILKRRIREAAEAEERRFYAGGAAKEWLKALAPLGTDENKEYLETAPYIIIVFCPAYGVSLDGSKFKHYYATESVGIATGILITALHHVGLATLTHTPNPMGFLTRILKRPANERPFVMIPVGYPAEKALVPEIPKKPFEEVVCFL